MTRQMANEEFTLALKQGQREYKELIAQGKTAHPLVLDELLPDIDSLTVVYSTEPPIRPLEDPTISCRRHCICPPGAQHKCTERRDIPGSTAFVPAVAGLLIAGEIIKDLSKGE